MNGGHGQQNNQPGWLTVRDGGMVTLEEYRRNQQALDDARALIAQAERQNEEAYRRFTMAEQELRNRVEQGREAERILAQLQAQRQGQHGQPSSYAMLPPAGPSQVALPTGYPAGPSSNANYATSNAMNTNPPQSFQLLYPSGSTSNIPQSATNSSYSGSNVLPYGYQTAAQAQSAPYSSQPTQDHHQSLSEPVASSYTSQAHPYTTHGQSSTSQHSTRLQQSRGLGQAVQPVASSSSQPLRSAHQPSQQQPPREASQRSVPVAQMRQAPSERAGHSSQPPPSRGQAIATPAMTPGISAAAQRKAPQAVASQDSRKRVNLTELEEDIRRAVQSLDYKQVTLVFRDIVHTLRDKLVRADGQNVDLPPLEDFGTRPELKRISDNIAEKMKDLTGSWIISLLHRIQGEIRATLASTPTTSPTSTNRQPAQVSNSHTTIPNGRPSVPDQPAERSQQPNAPRPSSTVIEVPATQSNGVPSESVPARISTPPTRSSAPRRPDHENVPSVVFPNLQRPPQTPQSGLKSSVLTPEQADKTRLARDILKSLGRPSKQFLAQVSSVDTPSTDDANGAAKRKRALSATELADKRPKTEGPEAESVLASQAATNEDASSSAPLNATDVIVVQPASQAPLRPPEAELVPGPHLPNRNATVAEEAVEISTPGAMELALNEAVAALASATRPQQEDTPMPHAPPPAATSTPSPVLESSASGPPTSRSPTPVHHQAPDGNVEMLDASHHPSSSALPNGVSDDSLMPPIATLSESFSAPQTPVAGPSKQPLFYVSPDSPPDGGYNTSLSLADGVPDFLPSGLLGGTPTSSPSKGKQRAYDDDSDVMLVDQHNRRGERAQSNNDLEVIEPSGLEELSQTKASSSRRAASKMKAYVLVPPASEEARGVQKRRNKGPTVVGGRVLSSQESSDDDADEIAVDFGDETARRQQDAEARAVHDLCYTRLRPSRCQWDGCDAVLDSAKRLGLHARMHADEYDENDEVMPCLWAECSRQYKSKERLAHHAQKHSLHPVICAYAGCDFESWGVHGMAMHLKLPKHRGRPLKPLAGPVPPNLNYVPPYMPEILPAYMTVEQPIRPAAIPSARHAALASKVLKNITTSTPLGSVDKSPSLRTPRRPKLSDKLAASLEAEASSSEPVPGPYDHWLLRRSGRVRRLCHDIPSKAVTDMFARGMVIDADWLARGDPDWHPDWHEEDADGETDHGEDVSLGGGPKPEGGALTVTDVEMRDAVQQLDTPQEPGPSRVQVPENRPDPGMLPGAAGE